MFGWRDVYVTMSMSDFAKARDALEQGGLKCRWRVNESASTFIGRGNMRSRGSIGINTDYAKQYGLYVKKQDLEQAQYLIQKALHG